MNLNNLSVIGSITSLELSKIIISRGFLVLGSIIKLANFPLIMSSLSIESSSLQYGDNLRHSVKPFLAPYQFPLMYYLNVLLYVVKNSFLKVYLIARRSLF